MPDTSDLYNPPRQPFQWLRHPFVLIFLALCLFFAAHTAYRRFVPAPPPVPTLKNPTGEWVGELTMDGRYYAPTLHGDTPGPHRHAVLRMQMSVSDSFLDKYHGPGTMVILGEGITRSFRTIEWYLEPDGNVEFEIAASPDLLQSEFKCEAEGTSLTCKNDDPLKPRLTLHPGTDADATALLASLKQQAATEPPLTPFPKTHMKVLCSDAYEEQSVSVLDDPPPDPTKPNKHASKPTKPKPPPPCTPGADSDD